MLVAVHPENVTNLGYDEDHCDAGVTWASFGMMRVLERQRILDDPSASSSGSGSRLGMR